MNGPTTPCTEARTSSLKTRWNARRMPSLWPWAGSDFLSGVELPLEPAGAFSSRQGAGPGIIVGVYLDRSFDSVISLLAILKCGGIYLPLDPKYPKDRLEFMMVDSNISLLLAHSAGQDNLPATSARVIFLDQEKESIAAISATNLGSQIESRANRISASTPPAPQESPKAS